MKLFLSILLCFFLPKETNASCAADERTFTEVLLDSNATIFTFTVIASFNDKGNLYSKATIDRIYLGHTISKNVMIYTGHLNSSVGGEVLKEGVKYLIFTGGVSDKYGGFGNCDRWSVKLSEVDTARLGMLERFKPFTKRKGMPQWIERSSEGKILAVGSFLNGKPISGWTFYHPNGKLKRDVVYDKKGRLIAESRYSEAGSKLYFNSYQNGRPEHSEYYSFEPDNSLQTLVYHTFKGNIRIDTYTLFYKDHQVKEAYTQLSNLGKNVPPHTAKYGQYQRFHENGRLAESGQYRRGMKYGVWLKYNEDGTLQTREILGQPQEY